MKLFQWNKAYEVFLPEIDAEHRRIFQMADALQNGIAKGEEPAGKLRMAVELAAHAAAHFAGEERQMRAARYPAFAWHKKQHGTAAARCASLLKCLKRDDDAGAQAALLFLSCWLKDHTSLADRMMAAHLRNRQRSFLAKAS